MGIRLVFRVASAINQPCGENDITFMFRIHVEYSLLYKETIIYEF